MGNLLALLNVVVLWEFMIGHGELIGIIKCCRSMGFYIILIVSLPIMLSFCYFVSYGLSYRRVEEDPNYLY